MRDETRKQRYDKKVDSSKKFPISVATINFMCDGNIGFIIRSAACFGAEKVHVIGALPEKKDLHRLSGGLDDYIEIIQHKNPHEFLEYSSNHSIKLVSAEICDDSKNLEENQFDFSSPICVVLGHEETGVPPEILHNSQKIHIEMPGVGFCLNTSQTGNIMLYEIVKQYKHHHKVREKNRDDYVRNFAYTT